MLSTSWADDVYKPSGTRGLYPNSNILFPEDAFYDCDSEKVKSFIKNVSQSLRDSNGGAQDLEFPPDPKFFETFGCKLEGKPKCYKNLDGDTGHAGSTYDDCIQKNGFVCSKESQPKTCCDFVKNAQGQYTEQCDCSAEFSPICKTNKDCGVCLCSAESGNQEQKCVDYMMCVAQGDASGDFCKATLAFSGNAFRYTAGRCVCDRTGDGRKWEQDDSGQWRKSGPAYGQNYCECCQARIDGNPAPDQGAWKKCEEAYKKALNPAKNCKEGWTHYGVGSCPCEKSRILKKEKCGDHIFCVCR